MARNRITLQAPLTLFYLILGVQIVDKNSRFGVFAGTKTDTVTTQFYPQVSYASG